jgi:predicted membrane protein|tara:strand:+ start:160 stop:381 length:222 start_codon:yes stop_codon:yes gene_type:complete
MFKNVKLTISSVLSAIILIALFIVFGIGFGALLLVYFLFRTYRKLVVTKSDQVNDSHEEDEVIDVDDDNYKIT